MTNHTSNPNQIMRPKEAAKFCGFSLAMFWNKANPKSRHYDPSFPKPFKISEKATGVRLGDLEVWIESKAKQNQTVQ